MKKLVSLVLALCLALGMASAFADEDITGTWYLTSAIAQGVTLSASDMGLDLSFVLNADGTATMIGFDENPVTSSWSQSGGTITIDGETATYENGELSIEASGVTMIFSRDSANVEATSVTGSVISADSEDAFFGSWKVDKVGSGGFTFSADMMSSFGVDDISVDIAAGKATINVAVTGSSVALESDTALENGALSITMKQSAYEEYFKFTAFELMDDGCLHTTLTSGGSTVDLYLSKK